MKKEIDFNLSDTFCSICGMHFPFGALVDNTGMCQDCDGRYAPIERYGAEEPTQTS